MNRHAIAEILELLTDDIEFVDPAVETDGRGRQAVHDYYVDLVWRTFPDIRFIRPAQPYLLAPMEPVVIVRWAAQAHLEHHPARSGNGARAGLVKFHGVDVWRFSDRQVCRFESIYDMASIARQIQALASSGT